MFLLTVSTAVILTISLPTFTRSPTDAAKVFVTFRSVLSTPKPTASTLSSGPAALGAGYTVIVPLASG